MILTDREIRLALQSGTLTIRPAPTEEAYASTSVDLTLDPTITEFVDREADMYFDPGRRDYKLEAVLAQETRRIEIGESDDRRYELVPGKLILAWTAEYVDLRRSPRLAARVEGKSSLGRLGLAVHVTAPTIHAGFNGRIRLEVINHGRVPIRLRPGMRICQLIFEQTLGTPEKGYRGRFSGQDTSMTV
jgi:dCTP deaminase